MTARAKKEKAEFSAEAELNEHDREMNDRIARWRHLEEYLAEQSVWMRGKEQRLWKEANKARSFRHSERPEIDEYITQLMDDAYECFLEAERCEAKLEMIRAELQYAEVC